jgi:ATP-binding cassette subfamily C protein
MCLFSTIVMARNDALNIDAAVLSTGHFLAFYAAFTTFLAAALEMSAALVSVIPIVAIHERIKPILETPPEVDKDKMPPGALRGEIEISHLSFRYHSDAPLILKDLSFTIKPGEFIALVVDGHSLAAWF